MAEAPEYPDSDFSDEDQSPLDVSFHKAADHVRKITSKLDNNQLLELYGLYKQGLEGRCNTPKPGWLDGRGRRKWEAWRALGDLECDVAKEKYVSLVEKYDPEWSELNKPGPKEAWVAVSSLQRISEPDLVHHELSILDAAREDLADRVSDLLSQNPELKHETDDDGLTALHWATDRDSVRALRVLIEAGSPIDCVDNCGQTALHYAASCGHIQSARMLMQAGASLIKDNDDCTPLDLAADDEIRQILKGAKSD